MHPVILTIIIVLVIVYVIFPLIFRFSSAIQRQLVFFPYEFELRWPIKLNYAKPEAFGLRGASHFYLETESNVSVGVWHILPACFMQQSEILVKPESSFVLGYPIVLYLHGNSGSRATDHRVELYQLLQSFNYNVITLDYRGFADSSQVLMSEDGAVADACRVYRYIREFSVASPIIVWGHSLGSGVATKMVSQLCAVQQAPDRLVLEAPFSSAADVFRQHPLTRIYRPLSVMDRFFTESLKTNNVAFDSAVHIARVECPTVILHALDDHIVPIFQPRKLYRAGLESRPAEWSPLELIEFNRDLGCGHKYICRAPEFPAIIQEFVTSGRCEGDYHRATTNAKRRKLSPRH